MARITRLGSFFMLSLLIVISISLSNAYPTIITSDGEEWATVTGPDAYKDKKTGMDWTTFKRVIPKGSWNSSIVNDVDGAITFEWRSDKKIGEKRLYRSIEFYKNGTKKGLSFHPDLDPKNISWVPEGPFDYNRQKDYKLDFIFEQFGGTIWIAFPPQPVQILPAIQNRPPNRPKLNKSSEVHLLLNETLWISAIVTDPDNDNIDIVWDWGDGARTESLGISSDDDVPGNHSWNDVGNYKITITARDSMANNSSMINLNVSYPLQPINASRPEQLTKPKFNVSSDGFLWLGYDLFISASSRDLNNNSINYSWDWGDRTPDGMSPLVPSGDDAIQSHSYRDPGNYTITITASTQKCGKSSSTINLTVLRPVPPETPQGEIIGYIDTSYAYSTALNTSFLVKDAILYNWSFDDVLDSTTNANGKIFHRWSNNGTKIVKVRALDIQGNPGSWSEGIDVDIYVQKFVSSDDTIQNIIDNAFDYTEIILNCSEYNLSSAISIARKDHISVKSSLPHTTLRNNQSVDKIIKIKDSNCINISKLSINESAGSPDIIALILIVNSYNCKLNKSIVDVNGYGNAPIQIKGGGNNSLEDIEIIHRNPDNGYGIIVENSRDNLVKNITFKFTISTNNFAHIVFEDLPDFNNNCIIKLDRSQILKIKMDHCTAIWQSGGTSLYKDGHDCQSYVIKSITDSELILR